jgi:hypothetical protein
MSTLPQNEISATNFKTPLIQCNKIAEYPGSCYNQMLDRGDGAMAIRPSRFIDKQLLITNNPGTRTVNIFFDHVLMRTG